MQAILDERSEADLEVLAVWFNVIAGDSRAGWSSSVLRDERVTHLWDEAGLIGDWFAERGPQLGLGELDSPLWDAYLLYGPEAKWGELPVAVASWGSPVIYWEDRLREALLLQVGVE